MRLEAFGRVRRKELSVVQAAELIGLSLRQAPSGLEAVQQPGRSRAASLAQEVRHRVAKIHQELGVCGSAQHLPR